ncbi:MAG: peptidoglycan bridge formation glycyltransferase FemA/FemB family protein [Bacilli bacterium]|nr:peptidoglycan bridge formation glycyltransferase FemA/FemB family protein [Bacilli bacterium]
MKLQILTPKEYEKFAKNHVQATFLQSMSWSELKKENGWHHELLGFKEGKKIIAATLLLSKQTPVKKKMFYAPRGFLLDYQNEGLLKEFTLAIKQHVRKNNGIFFKIDPYIMKVQRDIDGKVVEEGVNNLDVVESLKKLGYKEKCSRPGQQTLQSKFMYWIDLKNRTLEDVMKDMSSKTRQMIRKNEKNGVIIREGNYEEMDKFKNIMDHTGKRREFISRPLRYLQNMYKAFGNGKELKLYFAELHIEDTLNNLKEEVKVLEDDYNKVISNIESGKAKMSETKLKLKKDEIERINKRIEEYEKLYSKHGSILMLGGIMYFIYGKEVLSFIGGAYEEFMEFQPFYTLHYEMIKYALENGYEHYNFYGISSDLTPKDPMYGIYIFKKGFGGEVVELIGEYDYIVNKGYYIIYDISFKIVRFLKKIKTKLHL